MIQKTTGSSPSTYFVWLGRCNMEADQHQAVRAGGCCGGFGPRVVPAVGSPGLAAFSRAAWPKPDK